MTLKLYSNVQNAATSSLAEGRQAAIDEAATQAEILGYLSDMAAELRDMARRAGFVRLERTLIATLEQADNDRALLLRASAGTPFQS